jgi:hypothetical protein
MLSQDYIAIGKLKKAYGLNAQEAQDLLCVLTPDNVFPYILWKKAYVAFWRSSAEEISRLYKGTNPSFPELGVLPDDFFPTETYAKWIGDFFIELAKFINVKKLEDGTKFIIEYSYDGNIDSILKDEIEGMFELLVIDEKHFYRSGGDRLTERKRYFDDRKCRCIYRLFQDTIIVNKSAAINHLFECGYPLRQEVKGISQAIVERITSMRSPTSAEKDHADPASPAIVIPRALWEGKPPAIVRDAMRDNGYSDAIIAFALFEWCKLKNKTQIGRLLADEEKEDSSYLRLANRLLAEAAALSIVSA